MSMALSCDSKVENLLLGRFVGTYQVEESWRQTDDIFDRETTDTGSHSYELTIEIFDDDYDDLVLNNLHKSRDYGSLDENDAELILIRPTGNSDDGRWGTGGGTIRLDGDLIYLDYRSFIYHEGSNGFSSRWITGTGVRIK